MAGNPIQKSFCTTREAARMLGISLSTAQLWVDSGLLQGWKTDGGHRPDMMIADLFMPDVDGIQMLRTIRAEPQHKDLPIVVATGLSPFDIAAHGDLPAGIPIFQKPVPFEKLRQLAGELALRKWREL
ncbi:MAG: response regulator [Proteobacteria bacterium]|nr:response regulator [Pseudomonadota bacterium]